jgi:hypothetical protein
LNEKPLGAYYTGYWEESEEVTESRAFTPILDSCASMSSLGMQIDAAELPDLEDYPVFREAVAAPSILGSLREASRSKVNSYDQREALTVRTCITPRNFRTSNILSPITPPSKLVKPMTPKAVMPKSPSTASAKTNHYHMYQFPQFIPNTQANARFLRSPNKRPNLNREQKASAPVLPYLHPMRPRQAYLMDFNGKPQGTKSIHPRLSMKPITNPMISKLLATELPSDTPDSSYS